MTTTNSYCTVLNLNLILAKMVTFVFACVKMVLRAASLVSLPVFSLWADCGDGGFRDLTPIDHYIPDQSWERICKNSVRSGTKHGYEGASDLDLRFYEALINRRR